MKTFLKLIAAVTVFGLATANAAGTYSNLADAEAKVAAAATKASQSDATDADIEALKTTVANAVAQFPESAGDIVKAGLKAPNVTEAIQTIIVRVAAWTAPGQLQLANIIVGITGSGLGEPTTTNLRDIATRVAGAANTVAGKRDTLPPNTVS